VTALPVRHDIAWVAAAPLWPQAGKVPSALRQPTLLGFGHDGFMDELLATLEKAPAQIAARVASGPSRSYRDRLPGEAYGAAPIVESAGLKLYQPVHGWFYLVTGSLVCRLPGLPDHQVDLGGGESAGFVVRRLTAEGSELALVSGSGDRSGSKRWQSAAAATVAEGEEVLPLFPLGFLEGPRRRKLLAGLIPTGNQELLQSAPIAETPAPAEGPPAAAEAFEAFRSRVPRAIEKLQAPVPAGAPAPEEEQQREVSRFVLLDLADFLLFYLPNVLGALQGGPAQAGKAGALVSLLGSQAADPTVDGKTLGELAATVLTAHATGTFDHNLKNADPALPALLEAAVQDALDETRPGERTAPAPDLPRLGATSYVTRLVYRRPRCAGCGGDVVSDPSEPFQLSPYFDPEAPARPIRISLPIDASVAGLRKFKKSVRMVLSESLRQKMKTQKINDKLDGPNADCGGLELSIPIITIVAMIILFVFIMLLDLIFFWVPFVKICFPRLKVEL
jgi:hypothetical protein